MTLPRNIVLLENGVFGKNGNNAENAVISGLLGWFYSSQKQDLGRTIFPKSIFGDFFMLIWGYRRRSSA